MRNVKIIAVALTLVLTLVLLVATVSIGSANNSCKTVNGHISSQLLSVADGCESPLGLCTIGRYRGGIQGDFKFVALSASDPIPDTGSPPVVFTEGIITLDTEKYGKLTIKDASAFELNPADALFGGVQTIIPEESDDVSGRLRAYGVFQLGCVDCDYRGEICTP